jgi:signal transduction histidine kinase
MFCLNQHIVVREIRFTYKDGLPDDNCLIITDRTRLKQILINVVNNACKYTDSGSIEYHYKIDGDNLIFVVKDTGIGIPVEAQKHIFDRFMQASNGKTSGRESTGLGLSITKTYLNLMGGSISVKSEINAGSEFTFVLPNIFETHKTKINDTI